MILTVASKPRFRGLAEAMTDSEVNRVRKALVQDIQSNPAPIRNMTGEEKAALLVKLMGLVWPEVPGFNRKVDLESVQ